MNCRIGVITNIQKRSCPSQPPHEGPPDALALSRAALIPGRVPFFIKGQSVSIAPLTQSERTNAQSLVPCFVTAA